MADGINRMTFAAVMSPEGLPADHVNDPNNLIDEAFAYFCGCTAKYLSEDDRSDSEQSSVEHSHAPPTTSGVDRVEQLRITLCDLLKVVSITLEPDDNAQARLCPTAPGRSSGRPSPQLGFEPGSYDFGLQEVNSNASQTNLVLRNDGAEPVHIDSLELSGAGTEAFWIGNSNCWGGTNLQSGEACSVQVYFSPHDTVEYAVQVRVNVGPYAFSADLSGSGGSAVFTPSSNPTDFGTAAVGSPGTTREITVTNTGSLPGGAFIAVVSGGAVGSFHLLDENCTGRLLGPGGTCVLQVRFQPISEGVKTATLSLFGEGEGGTQIALSGVGTAPEPDPAPAAAAVAPSTQSSPPAVHPRSRHRRKHCSTRRHKRHGRAGIDCSRAA